MDFEYLTKVMSQVINFVVNENSWAWYSFPKAEVLNTLEELEPRFLNSNILHNCLSLFNFSRCILECCLNWFAQPTEEGEKLEMSTVFH